MGQSFDRHINQDELDALILSPSDSARQLHGLSPDAIRAAQRHVESCEDCAGKALKYRQLVTRPSNAVVSQGARPGPDCPKGQDVDWHEVAAGLWPTEKARQLIMHAALCDCCGPLLRAATSVDDDPTPQEEKLLAELKAPRRPAEKAQQRERIPFPRPAWERFLRWKVFVPAVALMLLIGVLATKQSSSPPSSTDPNFPEFAVNTYRQYSHGSLRLDIYSDSRQTLNEWFKRKLPFSLTLPVSAAGNKESRLYLPEGARSVRVEGNTAAYIAYRVQRSPVGLMVVPASVAVASGGAQVGFEKVIFHYRLIDGYRVVTWSVHGLTYALVSQEENSTQRSCMVCHDSMKDRDLNHAPPPLLAGESAVQTVLQ